MRRFIKSADELPPTFGLFNDGRPHPDTVLANINWNAALDKVLHLIRVRQAQWPERSSMYASLEDIARDAQALKRPTT